MAFIPSRPFVADDPLAYFAALVMPKADPTPALRPERPETADEALEVMFGYYTAD